VEKYGTARQTIDDNITRRMRFACWITKAIHTLRICNTYCFSTATMVTRTHLRFTLYVHCLSWLLRNYSSNDLNNMKLHMPVLFKFSIEHLEVCQLFYI
jgi:hypothetical protein